MPSGNSFGLLPAAECGELLRSRGRDDEIVARLQHQAVEICKKAFGIRFVVKHVGKMNASAHLLYLLLTNQASIKNVFFQYPFIFSRAANYRRRVRGADPNFCVQQSA